MPNRILKESICTSDSIDKLSAFVETVFYRLIVKCDDYGRYDARPKLLASELFPLKDIRVQQISDALRSLTSAELVTLYEVNGKPFLQMNNWDRHQTIRARRSKYPAPPGPAQKPASQADAQEKEASANECNHLHANDFKCNQVHANVPVIQSNPNPYPNPNPDISATAKTEAETGIQGLDRKFDAFWAAYPLRKNKVKAYQAFAKINPDTQLLEVMLLAIRKQKNWRYFREGYIPMPATWLNGHRWEDEQEQEITEGKTRTVTAQDYGQRDYDEEELENRLRVDA